jgi:poly-gamma-glutamate capsule biosynthesis protein CapA/YwtB (metallophosphatase superfamily)
VFTRKVQVALLAAFVAIVILIWWLIGFDRPQPLVQLRGSTDTLLIAATGDWFVFEPMPSENADRGYAGVSKIVKSATLGLTTIEQNLVNEKNVPAVNESSVPHWPYGTEREAKELRRIGFSVISIANSHATDYGMAGMRRTREILDHEGLRYTGAGDDLQQAMAPSYVGTTPRRVAVIALTTSAAPESRATSTQSGILGRPGVNVLRYSARVTVDASTFATLKNSRIDTNSVTAENRNQLMLSGTIINKGPNTAVEFVANERDTNEQLAEIKSARSKTDVVVVMLNSHEPNNDSATPAEFVEQFSHAAIDAGASVVVGSGPHQLRGIEQYHGGLILYSLGNFAFQSGAIDPSADNLYDTGIDFFGLTLGAVGNLQIHPVSHPEGPVWWESVIASMTFDHGILRSVQLQPVDLGVDLPLGQRGTPRLATPERGASILERLALLSQPFGTELRVQNGIGLIDIDQSHR